MVVEGRRLRVSRHAVERYHERVRPSLSLDRAERELRRVVDVAVFAPRPEYASSLNIDPGNEWLVLGDVAFLVRDGALVSCITRGSIGDELRERRAERKRERRLERAGQREKRYGRVRARERAIREQKRGEMRDE